MCVCLYLCLCLCPCLCACACVFWKCYGIVGAGERIKIKINNILSLTHTHVNIKNSSAPHATYNISGVCGRGGEGHTHMCVE